MVIKIRAFIFGAFIAAAMAASGIPAYGATGNNEGWEDTFDLENCRFSASGANSYFFLDPGYKLSLGGDVEGAEVELTITTLNETKIVNGTETRVVEERQTEDGELVEISKNYFSLCGETKDIYYFGEITDVYENGKVVSNEGSWEAGRDGAKPGIIFPGKFEVGMKYYQEVAPEVAMDRAEVVSVSERKNTPAGNFERVVKTEETTPLEPGASEFKYYAPGIGLIQEDTLELKSYMLPKKIEKPVEGELRSQVQSVVIGNGSIKVDLKSSSNISEFRLDEKSRKVNFKVQADRGTNGTTEISIGRILEGPYTVTLDGQPTQTFEVIKASSSGETVLRISYANSARNIEVSGTNIVPEFPLSGLFAVAAMVGIVIFLHKRSFPGSSARRI